MADTLESLRLDVEELVKLQDLATRQKVKDLLLIGTRRLQTEITILKEQLEKEGENVIEGATAAAPPPEERDTQKKEKQSPVARPLETLKTYSWDQSEKFMKMYVSLAGVNLIPGDQVMCQFGTRGFNLQVNDLSKKDYQLLITRLHEEIIPESSYYKVKTDMVLLMLKKKEQGKTWPYVTQREDKKKPKSSKNEKKEDGDGLMNLLQNMYDEGDDDMKRTIQKAWHDSQNKKTTTDMPTL